MEIDDPLNHPATNDSPDFVDEVAHFIEHGVDSAVGGVADDIHHLLHPGDFPVTGLPGVTWPVLPSFVPLVNTTPLLPATGGLIGDPADDVAYWHLQSDNTTCGIDAQQFVLEQLTGQQVSEAQLLALAQENGWYDGHGTPAEDCGNLLQLFGLTVEHRSGASVDDIADQLAQGHGVIVGVNAETIWGVPQQDATATTLASIPVIPNQDADHAVEVIGIDKTDPQNPMVILNDSGTPNGAGEMVPLSTFLSAWAGSGNMMIDAW